MRSAEARGTWCHTCGTYVRPGTHGIHAMTLGGGALRSGSRPPSDDAPVGGAHAIVLVLMLIAGFVAAVFLVAAWLVHAGR